MISQKSRDLILSFEGFDVPWRWPGQSSGITIGRGYDLGYEPFDKDWAGLLPDSDYSRLSAVQGLTGHAARDVAPTLRGIHVPVQVADTVFETVTLPKYEEQTRRIFPNSDQLPGDAFGALVSLVYNRGTSLDPNNDRRREMVAIHDILVSRDPTDPLTVTDIAAQVRSMARLWPDHADSDRDLHDRRIMEAELIESSSSASS